MPGLDNVSTFRKLHVFSKPGERIMAIASAGNLAMQPVGALDPDRGLEDPPTGEIETLMNAPTMVPGGAAHRPGDPQRARHRRRRAEDRKNVSFDVSFLFGGQIKGSRMRLFMVYTAGNFIECHHGHAVFADRRAQIRKPVLDPPCTTTSKLYEALKTSLISMDSTMRSNLGVGLPIDVLVVRHGCLRGRSQSPHRGGRTLFPRSAFRAGRRRCARRIRTSRDHPTRPKQKPRNRRARKPMAEAANKIAVVTRCRHRRRTRGIAGADERRFLR